MSSPSGSVRRTWCMTVLSAIPAIGSPATAFLGAAGQAVQVSEQIARPALRGTVGASIASGGAFPVAFAVDPLSQGAGTAVAQWAGAGQAGGAAAGAAAHGANWFWGWAAAIGGAGGIAAKKSGEEGGVKKGCARRRRRRTKREAIGTSQNAADGVMTGDELEELNVAPVQTSTPSMVLVPCVNWVGGNGMPALMQPMLPTNALMQGMDKFNQASACSSPTSASLAGSYIENSNMRHRSSTSSVASSNSTTGPRWTARDADLALAHLQGDDDSLRNGVMEQIVANAWPMAVSKHGCRILQSALHVAESQVRLTIVEAFKGHVWEAIRSPHANHVLQQCIVLLPPVHTEFVIEELQGTATDAARHQFGCRVLERLLEHDSPKTSGLVEELVYDGLELSKHPYANFVMQHVLEHGTEEQRRTFGETIRPEIRRLARHKCASHVVETLLRFSSEESKQAYKAAMSGDAQELASLNNSNYGSFVAKAMRRP